MTDTLRPLTKYEMSVWPAEMVAGYELQRAMTPAERRFLITGFLGAVRAKCAAADREAAERDGRAA